MIVYNKNDIDDINNIKNIESTISTPFEIPDDIEISDPEEFYDVLYDISNKLNVNFFRNNIIADKDGNLEIIKYVLFSSKTKFYKNISISGEKITSKNISKDTFLSSHESNNKNQIGIINDFGNNNTIVIEQLSSSYKKFSVGGIYYVELPYNLTFDEFVKEFTNSLNTKFNTKYNPNSFEQIDINNDIYLEETSGFLTLINKLLLFFCLIIVVYLILNSSKKINIYKLHGSSTFKTWMQVIQNTISISFILITFLLILLSMTLKLPIKFNILLLLKQIYNYIIITFVSMIVFYTIIKSNINDALNNRLKDNFVIAFYCLIKIFITIFIISTVLAVLTNFSNLNDRMKSLDNWGKSKHYGVFYPVLIGEDNSKKLHSNRILTSNKDLYKILNKNGTILVNARDYEESSLIENVNFNGYRSMYVNPNYLNEFPIYDVSNKPINISEDEKDWILLVPDKYKSDKIKILNCFESYRKKSFEYEKESFSENVPESIYNQKVKVIWTKSNQEVFSFNQEVFKDKNNMITDPIIEVVTERNSISSDRWGILGGGNTDPTKIRLINNSTEETYKSLKPILEELKLDDNYKYLISSNELILKDIYELKSSIQMNIITIVMLIICFIVIALQNIIIIFNKEKRKFVIRRIHGAGFFKCYNEFIIIFSLTWVIQLCISIFINKPFNTRLILICIIFIIIEFIFSIIGLLVVESKNKVTVLKGE